MSADTILLSTAYLPHLTYLARLLQADTIYIEAQEYFVKQTYRNRCDILTSNGRLSLSVPLIKQSDKELITLKRISYAENWQQQHWRTITSAYKSSPYFEFFEDDFKPFYQNKYDFLFDYNLELLKMVLHLLRIKKSIHLTDKFEATPEEISDFRCLSALLAPAFTPTPYYQVFPHVSGFIPNLSCIDALFNVGLETLCLSSIKP